MSSYIGQESLTCSSTESVITNIPSKVACRLLWQSNCGPEVVLVPLRVLCYHPAILHDFPFLGPHHLMQIGFIVLMTGINHLYSCTSCSCSCSCSVRIIHNQFPAEILGLLGQTWTVKLSLLLPDPFPRISYCSPLRCKIKHNFFLHPPSSRDRKEISQSRLTVCTPGLRLRRRSKIQSWRPSSCFTLVTRISIHVPQLWRRREKGCSKTSRLELALKSPTR